MTSVDMIIKDEPSFCMGIIFGAIFISLLQCLVRCLPRVSPERSPDRFDRTKTRQFQTAVGDVMKDSRWYARRNAMSECSKTTSLIPGTKPYEAYFEWYITKEQCKILQNTVRGLTKNDDHELYNECLYEARPKIDRDWNYYKDACVEYAEQHGRDYHMRTLGRPTVDPEPVAKVADLEVIGGSAPS